ncbi:hypothetical protein C1T17_10455 [Sphingobium sp. SCG-1]|uniref:DUF2336 domain-containing protein n=1 Tax=Sphingobium sp. SCG-1 TaxID=2072936 RepID=UPI000CD69B66|nr:DUF2336 domain-containing protein [Sphingobium sp. SCG-1]AUW58462.1 hypothetical protein C1T17_10455 [Sphingobium sp. SCG-1]
MSAASFTIFDTEPSGSWPLAAAGSGPVGASVRHLIDLSHFFRDGVRGWPDALATEARRHIAGCLTAIEAALVDEARSSLAGSTLTLVDRPIIWPAVQRHPHILSPELMAHMRLRAAVSLLGAQALRGDGDPAADPTQGTAWLIEDDDAAVVDLAARLVRTEARWSAQAGIAAGSAMQADLPAEHFAELAWTSAAVLGTELYRAGLAEQNAAMMAMTDAAFALLARHDEEASGFALATRLARTLRDRGRHAELLGQALSERRYLLFAALAGELADVELDAVLDVLVHGGDTQLAALCKALGGTASDYRHLLLDLRIVRGERDDPTLVRLSQSYDDLREDDAADQMQALRRPAALRAKLAMIPQVDRG